MSTSAFSRPLARVQAFQARLGIQLPILLAPMAGACPPSLSIAVANAGGLGACGALYMNPNSILAWADEFRRQCLGEFQMNLWIPDPPAVRNEAAEKRQRDFLSTWGPAVTEEMGEAALPDFEAQCQTILALRPKAISSIMGLYEPAFITEMKSRGILWIATATNVEEARAAEAAGADAIVAQGMEAGGHRGAFHAEDAERQMVGLIALLPQVVDTVSVPVIAAGGIADGRAIAAALILGASAVQIGTGFLRCPEAQLHPAYAERLSHTYGHQTRITRAFTGRAGRSISTRYVEAAASPGAPESASFPIQRGFTRPMRDDAILRGDVERMKMWAGQAARFAQAQPAQIVTQQLWEDASQYLF